MDFSAKLATVVRKMRITNAQIEEVSKMASILFSSIYSDRK